MARILSSTSCLRHPLPLLFATLVLANQLNYSNSALAAANTEDVLLPRHGDHEHMGSASSVKAMATASTPQTSTLSGIIVDTDVTDVTASAEVLPSTSSLALGLKHDPIDAGEAHHDHSHPQPRPTSHSPAHHHHHAPSVPHIPSIDDIGLSPLIIPDLAHHSGHHHGAPGAPILQDLNETALLLAKGPDPLSYIEWDFQYGMAMDETLRRFTSDEYTKLGHHVMAVSGGRFRTLLDQGETEAKRDSLLQDLKSRVGTQSQHRPPSRHKWVMLAHIIGAVFSCFFVLPVTLCSKAANSSLAPWASTLYLGSLLFSLLLGSLYKTITPQLYPGNSHGKIGWAILFLSIACFGRDVIVLCRKNSLSLFSLLPALIQRSSQIRRSSQLAETQTMLGEVDRSSHEYPPLQARANRSTGFSDEGHGYSGIRSSSSTSSTLISSREGSLSDHHTASRSPWSFEVGITSVNPAWNSDESQNVIYASKVSEGSNTRTKRRFGLPTILHLISLIVSRGLPVVAFAAMYTGLAVYTGSCRAAYTNTCLAHGIKGGIFFWYGILTFARYLGAYADVGWAWNRRPTASPTSKPCTSDSNGRDGWKSHMPSAEWVECLVIFIYGATNTWMERFGAAPGDPYTVKQVQHISIAVMFWFAGALGLLLEQKWVKDLLSLPIVRDHPLALKKSSASSANVERKRRSSHSTELVPSPEALVEAQVQPPSYSSSFNPFPALCIGITGMAMSAHHQDYVYEVQIHQLWGNLLLGFSLLRCLTYFLLWLRPPTASILPSRPPTEALASFMLTTGGLVFMLSSEQVSFAAMRNRFDDFMALLCLAVAFVCLLFTWIAVLMVLKGWSVKREMVRSSRSRLQREEEEEEGGGEAQGVLERDGRLRSRYVQQQQQTQRDPIFVLGQDFELEEVEEEEGEEGDPHLRTQREQRQQETSSTSSPAISGLGLRSTDRFHLSASPEIMEPTTR